MDDTPTNPQDLPDLGSQTPEAQLLSQTAAQAPMERAPAAMGDKINVLDPEGNLVSVAQNQYHTAIAQGYVPATDADVTHYQNQQKYGGTEQSIIAGIEGAGRGVLGPLAPAIGQSLGATPEAQMGRMEANPIISGASEMAGLAGSLLTGVGEAALAEKAGAGVVGLVGLGAPETALAKIGSAAVKAAVENMAISGADETSRMVMKDPSQTAETALMNVGLGGAIGGLAGGAFHSVNPLWEAASGSKLGSALKGLTDRLGGVEGHLDDDVSSAISRSGLTIPDEIKAGLSNDDSARQAFKTLEQSDTTGAGRKLQKSLIDFKKQASDSLLSSLGVDPESAATLPELSEYEHGKTLGNTLAEELDTRISPISKEFDELRNKYGNLPLQAPAAERAAAIDPQIQKLSDQMLSLSKKAAKLQAAGNVEGSIEMAAKVQDLQQEMRTLKLSTEAPGTTDRVAEDIASLAQKENWTASPSSEVMGLVNTALKEIPALKNLDGIKGYITAVNSYAQKYPADGQLRRAAGMIKDILKRHEADILEKAVGDDLGAEAAARFKVARQAYARESQIVDELNDRLHLGSSTSGYSKALRQMASTDAETLLRRLSGKGDAHLLGFLQKEFPKTAQNLQRYHLASIIDRATGKAAPGMTVNANELIKSIEKMSPEMRNFVVPEDALGKIRAVGTILSELNKLPHNFSNTARTMDKLFQYMPGSALGLATMLMGHSLPAAALIGTTAKWVGKDAPDAIRLGYLKMMGSGKGISAPGFKGMVDFLDHAVKGDQAATKAVKNVFKAGREVLPQAFHVSDKDRAKLEVQLRQLQQNPAQMLDQAHGPGMHYLDQESSSLSQSTMQAVNYLNNLRPEPQKMGPLNKPIPPTKDKVSAYNRAMDVAISPLSVIARVKDGTVSPADVTHLKTMYPALYQGFVQKLTGELASGVSNVPYKTRIGLSIFMGHPMDSTLTPEAILSAQPSPQPQQGGQAQGSGPTKKGSRAFSKVSAQFQTEDQAAEARRATKS